MNNDALVIADMKTIIESTYTSDRIEDIADSLAVRGAAYAILQYYTTPDEYNHYMIKLINDRKNKQ